MAAMPADDIENMPDVIQLYSESVNLIRDYKRTVWTEDMLTTEGTMKKEDLMPGAVEEYSIGGRMIGMPWTTSALLLYYNQDYLDQAGVACARNDRRDGGCPSGAGGKNGRRVWLKCACKPV